MAEGKGRNAKRPKRRGSAASRRFQALLWQAPLTAFFFYFTYLHVTSEVWILILAVLFYLWTLWLVRFWLGLRAFHPAPKGSAWPARLALVLVSWGAPLGEPPLAPRPLDALGPGRGRRRPVVCGDHHLPDLAPSLRPESQPRPAHRPVPEDPAGILPARPAHSRHRPPARPVPGARPDLARHRERHVRAGRSQRLGENDPHAHHLRDPAVQPGEGLFQRARPRSATARSSNPSSATFPRSSGPTRT